MYYFCFSISFDKDILENLGSGNYLGLKKFSDNTGLASTELVSQDGTISDGTPLPVARSHHCMVTLHDGRVMILGGMPGSVR